MFDQRNTQSFSFGASGAVVRLFSIQIIFNLLVASTDGIYAARDESRLNAVGPAVKQTQRGMKHDFFSANEPQLSGCICSVQRLAELDAFQYRYLISADD